MKVNYFGYYFLDNTTQDKVLFDIRPFIKKFCATECVEFKNSFTHQDEHIYLLHHINDVYLFIITRSNEVIRKINTTNLSVDEIHSLLEKDEQLGFASYVIIKDHYFGFGSTLLAPKADIFSRYINLLLISLGIVQWTFIPQVLLYQATRAEAMKLPFIGKTCIELSKENSFLDDFLKTISADTTDTLELESLEIIIKPKSKQNIKPTVVKFLDNIQDEGVKKIIMKAKSENASQLTDLYLIGSGAISDNVDKNNESKIADKMEAKLNDNEYLTTKVSEFTKDENKSKNNINDIVRYHNSDSWSDFISNIQQTDSVESN